MAVALASNATLARCPFVKLAKSLFSHKGRDTTVALIEYVASQVWTAPPVYPDTKRIADSTA